MNEMKGHETSFHLISNIFLCIEELTRCEVMNIA